VSGTKQDNSSECCERAAETQTVGEAERGQGAEDGTDSAGGQGESVASRRNLAFLNRPQHQVDGENLCGEVVDRGV
jgi:hypothetical protein